MDENDEEYFLQMEEDIQQEEYNMDEPEDIVETVQARVPGNTPTASTQAHANPFTGTNVQLGGATQSSKTVESNQMQIR